MDLKDLLVRSLGSTTALEFHKRITVGKKCYAVGFNVVGKMLSVTNLKVIPNKKPVARRVAKLYRILNKRRSCRTLCEEPLEPFPAEPLPVEPAPPQDEGTQTFRPEYATKQIETDRLMLSTKFQQTWRTTTRKISTQTDLVNISQSIQTDYNLTASATQTEERMVTTSSSQANAEVWTAHVQTDALIVTAINGNMQHTENETVIFLLNEIGEMILNQNKLLDNNATLLDQISEVALLNRVASRQETLMRNKLRLKAMKTRARLRWKKNTRLIYVYKNRAAPDTRHKAIQTEEGLNLDTFCKSTQTTFDLYNLAMPKKSKFSLF